jgi:fermentation-respiration switch protein FrsA (DUF1100 family)
MRPLKRPLCALLSVSLALMATSCRNYSTATVNRLAYHSDTAAGHVIAATLRRGSESPLIQLGGYLDAVDAARAALKSNPADAQARADYNFAVSRVVEVADEAGLQPWKTPLHCPGAGGEWLLSYKTDQYRGLDPADFELRSSDRYSFKGKLVKERALKDGLGGSLVATSKGIDVTKVDQFAQGKHIYYGLTAVLDFHGRNCEASLLDPLATESVKLDGNSYPLAADFTAPIALALAELKPGKVEIQRMFDPEKFKSSERLARLQPYDARKIPVLLIHGLGDSQATWAPMVEALRSNATFRQNYQIWFYSYPTGYPYPLMAAVLREQLDAINRRYPDHKPIVVIGHSMGGMIARTLMTDSGLTIWNAIFDTPPEKTQLSPEAREFVTKALIFKHRPEISRVIYCSASLRGSYMSTGLMGKIGSGLIGSPSDLSAVGKEIAVLAKPKANGERVKNTPNSIQMLDPDNRFVNTINNIPLTKGIPYHSVIGDRGKGGNLNQTKPMSTDGIVPYWSSHLDGAESELIVPSDHWCIRNPQGIAEVQRILLKHLQPKGGALAPAEVTHPPATAAQ